MKRRTKRTINFLAFNLLFFSLYLNFIHKDQDTGLDPVSGQATTNSAPSQVVKSQPVEKHSEEVKAATN